MNTEKDIRRNEPVEKGRNNDPGLRDDSSFQPGVNTVSRSQSDEHNKKLTETSKDNFRPDSNKNADRIFDEGEE